MKKVRIFLGLLLIIALLGFTGCGSNDTDTIDPDTPGTTMDDDINDEGILDDDDEGILDDNDDDILDDDNNGGDILDNDNNSPLETKTKTATDSSIGN